jgi:UDP-N-acetylmuramoylalanine--D-glutamate ligase
VVGLGIEGVDLVRYLARRGAIVTVADDKTLRQLRARLDEVEGLAIDLRLGSDAPSATSDAEAVFVSQGVPLDSPALVNAASAGTPIYSMVQMFLELAPGPVVGITGSSGKSTTTALVAEIFRADERPTFVGGNIGVGLLDQLDALRPYTWSVLEISHTQLQIGDRGPYIAAVLNITPNHLDRFSWDDYKTLKANLVRHQQPGDITVLNFDDPETRALEGLVAGRLLWFTMGESLPADGVLVRDGRAISVSGGTETPLFDLGWLPLKGRHNQENAVAAAAIAVAAGVSVDAIVCGIESFRGVPHRLEPVATVDGVTYYNDSIATTPERAIAGLRSFSEPMVLMLGGRDKELPMEDLAREALSRCRGVVLFGEAAEKIENALLSAANPRGIPIVRKDNLEPAFREARQLAREGDVVLLSPACTSYDAYDNFERRGDHFRSLVAGLTTHSGGEERGSSRS